MRKSFDGLYGLVRDYLLCDPLSGHLFLFSNAQRNRLRILFFDGSGLWVCAKRLRKDASLAGSRPCEEKIRLSHEELALLLGGIDLHQTSRRRWFRKNDGGESDDLRAPDKHCTKCLHAELCFVIQ